MKKHKIFFLFTLLLLCSSCSINKPSKILWREVTNIEKAKFLLDSGADINQYSGYSGAMEAAVCHRDIDLAKFYFENGALINTHDVFGETPLYTALEIAYRSDPVAWKRKEASRIADWLVDIGANVNYQLSEEIAGGPLDIKGSSGASLLHLAVSRNEMGVVRGLLFYGACIDITTSNGMTPLHVAIIFGRKECVKELLLAGANTSLLDCHNKSALDYAKQQVHKHSEDSEISRKDSEIILDFLLK